MEPFLGSEDLLIDMAELFKVFGDSTRIKILCCLFDGEMFVQELADRYGAEYLDFNLAKREYLDLTADEYIDVDHLNGAGAEKLTRLLAEADGKPIDEYFNACYDDKYE